MEAETQTILTGISFIVFFIVWILTTENSELLGLVVSGFLSFVLADILITGLRFISTRSWSLDTVMPLVVIGFAVVFLGYWALRGLYLLRNWVVDFIDPPEVFDGSSWSDGGSGGGVRIGQSLQQHIASVTPPPPPPPPPPPKPVDIIPHHLRSAFYRDGSPRQLFHGTSSCVAYDIFHTGHFIAGIGGKVWFHSEFKYSADRALLKDRAGGLILVLEFARGVRFENEGSNGYSVKLSDTVDGRRFRFKRGRAKVIAILRPDGTVYMEL